MKYSFTLTKEESMGLIEILELFRKDGEDEATVELRHNIKTQFQAQFDEMEKDEQGRYQLPYLMESDISGNPVTIKVVHDKWTNSEGEERVTPLAVNVFKSKDRVAPLKDEELPF